MSWLSSMLYSYLMEAASVMVAFVFVPKHNKACTFPGSRKSYSYPRRAHRYPSWSSNSTYSYWDFYMSTYKYKRHSRAICFRYPYFITNNYQNYLAQYTDFTIYEGGRKQICLVDNSCSNTNGPAPLLLSYFCLNWVKIEFVFRLFRLGSMYLPCMEIRCGCG